jgi:16S rRNA (cytosine967-C5)-methyltransferase
MRKTAQRGLRRSDRAADRRALSSGPAAGLGVRRFALEILQRVETTRAFADVLLGHRIVQLADPSDRRLLTLLVLGTIAWQGRLDYELEQLSSRPLAELDLTVHVVLRLGLFQLRQLTRIPAHAAVDTAVRLTHESRGAAAGGFVNAILRAATRRRAGLPRRSVDPAFLAVVHSHPRWLVERFVRWFGAADAEAIMAADNQAAPTTIRLNLARGSADEILAQLGDEGIASAGRGLFPETIRLSGGLPALDRAPYRAGLFAIQAEASQLVAHLLAPPPGATVVDCAAAPGGKSGHLAEMVGPGGRVIALDLNLTGLKQGRSVAARLRHRQISFVRCDTAAALPLRPATFGYVLLDAPCTGLGTLREHPEIRWRLQPGDLARIAELQARMLENAAALLAPDGALVYSVCSFAPEEGEVVINRFRARHPQFMVDIEHPRGTPLAGLIDADGFMRTRPDRSPYDGFFAVRLKRGT